MTDYLEALLPEEEPEQGETLTVPAGLAFMGEHPEDVDEETNGLPAAAAAGSEPAPDRRRETALEPGWLGSRETGDLPLPQAAPGLAEVLTAAKQTRRWSGLPAGDSSGAQVLLTGMGRARRAAMTLFRRENGAGNLAAPGEGPATSGLRLEEIDRAVERDARRYDGGFSLY